MDLFGVSSVAQRVKARRLQKQQMMETEEKSVKNRTRCNIDCSRESSGSDCNEYGFRQSRKKLKSDKFAALDDGDDIVFLGESYVGGIKLDKKKDKFVILDESSAANSRDSEEDDIIFLGETYLNTVHSSDDGYELKQIESKKNKKRGKDVEVSSDSEQDSDETCKFGRTRSSFATTSKKKEEDREENNDERDDTKLKNPSTSSTSRREGKDLLEFVDDTSFDWSDESLPSSAAANNKESDVSNNCLISSSDSEPDDSDDEDFDIEHPDSPLRDREDSSSSSFISSSSEDEASEKERTVDVPPPILQEEQPGTNEIPEIHEENLCCNGGVAEAECSRNSVANVEERLRSSGVKGESCGKKSRIGDSSESSVIKHGKDKRGEGLRGEHHLSHIHEVDPVEDSRNFTELKTVQIQEECISGMENQKRKIGSKRNQGPVYGSGSNTNADKESNTSMVVEDPIKENSDFQSIKTLETNHCLAGTSTTKKNKIWFSNKTHQNQKKKSELSKALINSMLRRFEAPTEKFCEPEEKEACTPEEAIPSSTERSLPLKFRFEEDDEKSKLVEKSEYENMVDGLFSEMHNLMYSDSNVSNDSSKDANEKLNNCNINENKLHPCLEGKHELVVLENIGEVCRCCNHVEREMKHILPPFAKIQGSTGRKCVVDRGNFIFEVVDTVSSVDNLKNSFNGREGTVWDMIPGIKETMYQHQQDGFEFLWKNLQGTVNLGELKSVGNSSEIGGGCIISHAPGTGKTRLTIVFIVTYLKLFPDARPVIIAPASMLLTWEEEFKKWKVEFPFHNLNSLDLSGKEQILVGKSSREKFVRLVKLYSWNQETSILGVSYQLFERLVGERRRRRKGNKKGEVKVVDQESENIRKILLQHPRLVVLDEGHTPRSQNSCIWNTLLKLETERRIILSGTPFQNNFRELFNTFHLVRPTIASSLAKEKAFAEIIPSRGRNRVRVIREREGMGRGFRVQVQVQNELRS